MLDFEEARDKVLMGVERKSMVLSDDEKNGKRRITKRGHADLVISIVKSRSAAQGNNHSEGNGRWSHLSLPGEDKAQLHQGYIIDRICIFYGRPGGRGAGVLHYDHGRGQRHQAGYRWCAADLRTTG